MPTVDEIFDNPTGWLKPKQHAYERYIGRRWADLEFEEQAAVRRFTRDGLLRIDTSVRPRRVVKA